MSPVCPPSLLGPAAVAALISGFIAIIGFVITTRNAQRLHREKLAFDRDLVERKVNADIALAEKKLALDQGLLSWRRRNELAEQTLIAFYEARDALHFARISAFFQGEGKSRHVVAGESDTVREKRETYFIPIERLNNEKAVFARLQSLRQAFAAHFGEEAARPFALILGERQAIVSTATICIDMVNDYDHPTGARNWEALHETLGWSPSPRPDKTDARIADAVASIEAICKPVLADRSHL